MNIDEDDSIGYVRKTHLRRSALPYQIPLPIPYPQLSEQELLNRIQAARTALGKSLVILAHHYQRPEIVPLGDAIGDSLKLCQFAAQQTQAKYVVFCGVHFMAESADILKTGNQTVILPDLEAGCDMADMANLAAVEQAWEHLTAIIDDSELMPVTYVNCTAELKAFVGKKGGIVCTSGNAQKIIAWAFEQKKRIIFFPDQHLGRNTCHKMGIPLKQMRLWDPQLPGGGLSEHDIKNSTVFLWKGYCPVHLQFTAAQVDALRQRSPQARIIVHPECDFSVVEKAEYVGSTEYIVKMVSESPAGTHWGIGTEANLVARIAKENPSKVIESINRFTCLCGTMNRIDLPHLAWALDNIVAGTPQNIIAVPEPTREHAWQALHRMLKMS
jgi:quinolinate synthase